MEGIMKQLYPLRGKGVRYSEAFKRKVVQDIITGIYSANKAREVYDIGGKMTIYKWLDQYGIPTKFNKQEAKMKKQKGQNITDLQARVRLLEQVVADLSLEKKILETTIDIANQTYNLDLKKNTGIQSLEKSIEKVVTESVSKK